jgi:metallo-beta-lactamase family protein
VNLRVRDQAGKEMRIAFSGDIGRYHDPLLRAPDDFPQADIILVECTYGDKLHGAPTPVTEELLAHIQRTCIEKGGKLIVPAFAVGRTQELVFALNRLSLEKRLPDVPIYVDSPLANDATETIKEHTELLNDSAQRLMKIDDDVFDFPGLQIVSDIDESKAIDKAEEASVIISASGMAEGGRIRAHIAAALEDERNTILLVGHSEPSTLGGQLRAGADEVAIFGDEYEVLADVEALGSMSAHGDYEDLLRWLDCQDPEKVQAVYLVHGEYQTQQAFRERLLRKGFKNVVIPDQHSVAPLSPV